MRFDQNLTLPTNLEPPRVADVAERRLKVFKFGGSVLRANADLPRVAGEIYRHVREGARVIAVVSAFEGETDRLLQQCAIASGEVAQAGIPDIVSLGEEKSAQLLRLACDRIGLTAAVLKPEILGIITKGDPLESEPLCLSGALAEHIGPHDVLIVPGFVGLDADGRRTLLGRGGTDFSAIFIAGETGATLRLYKDVDGVYDHDPAADPNDLARYERVSWQDCLSIARPLLQPRAVEYASRKKLTIEVGAIGSTKPTIVAAASHRPTKARARAPLKVGLAGVGTVGQAVLERLTAESNFELAAILVRNLDKPRSITPPCPLMSDKGAFFDHRFDILIDATSDPEASKALCIRQLAGLGAAVSASKAAIAGNLRSLLGLAERWGGQLRYSAAVGGSAPMLEMARRARARGGVVAAIGILNGTVNFLLDAMADGASFDAALMRARCAGFAEADPAADLSGADAACKLRILAANLWGEDGLDLPIDVQPLDAIMQEKIEASRERWLQVSRLRRHRGSVIGSVEIEPASAVPIVSPTPAEWNCLHLRLDSGETLSATGRGAGGSATAEAIMADLFDILATRKPRPLGGDRESA